METGNPLHASHLSNEEYHCELTFLFLLPSAPISVTGHQHCNLSATSAPHPGAHIVLRASTAACPQPHAQHAQKRLDGDSG